MAEHNDFGKQSEEEAVQYLVVVSFSPWKSVESVGEKYNFAYVELALIII